MFSWALIPPSAYVWLWTVLSTSLSTFQESEPHARILISGLHIAIITSGYELLSPVAAEMFLVALCSPFTLWYPYQPLQTPSSAPSVLGAASVTSCTGHDKGTACV